MIHSSYQSPFSFHNSLEPLRPRKRINVIPTEGLVARAQKCIRSKRRAHCAKSHNGRTQHARNFARNGLDEIVILIARLSFLIEVGQISSRPYYLSHGKIVQGTSVYYVAVSAGHRFPIEFDSTLKDPL